MGPHLIAALRSDETLQKSAPTFEAIMGAIERFLASDPAAAKDGRDAVRWITSMVMSDYPPLFN